MKGETHMKTSMLLRLVLIAIAGAPLTSHAKIENIFRDGNRPPTCEGVHGLERGGKIRLRITGAWTDYTSSVTGTGGVTGRKLGSDARGPWVEIELSAASNATLGRRTVTLNYPAGRDTFQVLVLEPRRVDSIALVSNPTGPFTSLSLLVNGRNIPQTLESVSALGADYELSQLAGGSNGGAITNQRATRLSANQARVDLTFAQPMQRAVIDVKLTGGDACFGTYWFGEGPARVSPQTSNRIVAQSSIVDERNFVTDIQLDRSTPRPTVGNTVTFNLTLKDPVPKSFGSKVPGAKGVPNFRGETIYFKLVPARAFEVNGRPVSATSYQSIAVAPGQREAKITAVVVACPVTSANVPRANFTIQTATHNVNAQSAPERLDKSFSVECPIPR
jgi:hypothetical protein